MRAAIIENNRVVNVILANAPEDFDAVACGDDVKIGWSYDGSEFTPPEAEPEDEPTAEELRESMPTLTARQFRLGLISAGITLSSVDTSIAAIADATEKQKAEVEWEYATAFKRTHPLVVSISSSLGLTAEQVDTMWTAALSM